MNEVNEVVDVEISFVSLEQVEHITKINFLGPMHTNQSILLDLIKEAENAVELLFKYHHIELSFYELFEFFENGDTVIVLIQVAEKHHVLVNRQVDTELQRKALQD